MWRTIKLTTALLGSLVLIALASPVLWVLGRDRRERNASELCPYDDDDLGEDIDLDPSFDSLYDYGDSELDDYYADRDELDDLGGEA
jgi:hypothetical protein